MIDASTNHHLPVVRSRPRGRAFALGGALIAVAALSALPAAEVQAAPNGAQAQILVIQGTNQDGGASIDPQLSSVAAQLTSPPLNTYNTYAQRDRQLLPLSVGKSVSYAVVDGSRVQLTLVGATSARYHLTALISRASASPATIDVTVSPGDVVFVGGQPYGAGAIFIGLSVVSP